MTTTVLVRDEPNGVLRERVRRLVGTPPGQLRALVVGLVVLCLTTGAVGVVEIAHRRATLTEVTQKNIPLAGAALEVYQSLSDADATANSVFLAGDQATAAQRDRYLTNVEEAAVALSTAPAGASPCRAVHRLANRRSSRERRHRDQPESGRLRRAGVVARMAVQPA